MILDAETIPKSPAFSNSDSQQNPISPTHSSFSQYPQSRTSYSTFPESNLHASPHYRNVSDITTLLDRTSPQYLSDDEQPPAYDDVRPSRKASNRFWARFAGIVLTFFLMYSTWASYQFSKTVKPAPKPPSNLPPSNSLPPTSPTSPAIPIPTPPVPPPLPAPAPTKTPLPPLPPYQDLPGSPDAPYILPVSGRDDLCRPWAYSADDGVRPSHSDNKPIDHLLYNVSSLAPIHIEASAVCPTANGVNKRCTDYEGASDSVSGKLQVVGADIELPQIDLLLQHGSELGLDDVSICMMRQPLVEGRSIGDKDYKWVLGISIWKDPKLASRNNLLASVSIIVHLPYSHVHDLTTNLDYFTQIIGPRVNVGPDVLSFDTLRLAGDYGDINVLNVEAASIEGISSNNPLEVAYSRISRSLSLRSENAMVVCNVTLVHPGDERPIQVNLESEVGTAVTIVDLEYPSNSAIAPRFDLKSSSRYSRSMIWVTDRQGTKALRNNNVPSPLPNIHVNATAQFAIAQALVPATYHGSMDLSSQYASIVTNDRATRLLGRRIEWSEREAKAARGKVSWDESPQDGGSVHVATEYAAVRLLFLGLEDDALETWPTEGNELEFGLKERPRLEGYSSRAS